MTDGRVLGQLLRRGASWAVACRVLLQHARLVWKTGQLRFRLETFGLYWPALPYERPWWHLSPRAVRLLLARSVAYSRWVLEMHALEHEGPEGWWRQYRSAWKVNDE